jgi:hypothetical protein
VRKEEEDAAFVQAAVGVGFGLVVEEGVADHAAVARVGGFGTLSRWLTGGMIFWLISLGGVVGGECIAVVQGSPVPGRGDLS